MAEGESVLYGCAERFSNAVRLVLTEIVRTFQVPATQKRNEGGVICFAHHAWLIYVVGRGGGGTDVEAWTMLVSFRRKALAFLLSVGRRMAINMFSMFGDRTLPDKYKHSHMFFL